MSESGTAPETVQKARGSNDTKLLKLLYKQ